ARPHLQPRPHMAKARAENDKPKNKTQAVRQILEATPTAAGSEISRLMKSQFNLDMNPKVAGTYRYHIQKSKRRSQRKLYGRQLGWRASRAEPTAWTICCEPRRSFAGHGGSISMSDAQGKPAARAPFFVPGTGLRLNGEVD